LRDVDARPDVSTSFVVRGDRRDVTKFAVKRDRSSLRRGGATSTGKASRSKGTAVTAA